MIQNWELRARQNYKRFVKDSIEFNNLGYIFLLERKGKLFDFLQLIPSEFSGFIGYDWSMNLFMPSELEDKNIGIFDDLIRHGAQLKKFCEIIKKRTNGKANTYAVALMGPKDDSTLEIDAHFKDTINENDFGKIIATITNYLLSKGIPLDVDHPIIQLKLKPNEWSIDYDEFLKFLETLGYVFFISPLPSHRHNTITLDQPLFFDISEGGKNQSIEKEGVIKIRLYINRNEGTWYLVPVVFPKALINIKKYSISCVGKKKYKVPFCKTIPNYEYLDNRTKIECCYRCITVNLGLILILKFLERLTVFMKNRDCPFPQITVLEKELNWYYGPSTSKNIINSLNDDIYALSSNYNKAIISNQKQLDLFTSAKRIGERESEGPSKNYIDDIMKIFKDYDENIRKVHNDSRLSRGLSYTEIKAKNIALKDIELSKALDILLDLGVLKPLIILKDKEQIIVNDEDILEDKIYQVVRAYRLGEAHDKNSWPDIYVRAQTARMVPHLLNRIIELNDLKNGVSSLKGYKSIWILKKMCKHIEFNIDKEYDLYGPVPYCPEMPTLPKMSLKDLADNHGTFEMDFSKRPVILKPKLGWDSDLDEYFRKEFSEDVILRSWSDIIATLYPMTIPIGESKSMDGKRHYLDATVTMSTCCNEEEVYEAEYHVILNEWKPRLLGFLDYLKRNLKILGNYEIKKETDEHATKIAEAHSEFGNKLMRYQYLDLLKKEIESINWPYGYRPFINTILNSFEIPPKNTYRTSHLKKTYLIVRSFTNLARNILSTAGYASPPRNEEKTIEHYLDEFIRQGIIAMNEKEQKEFVYKIREQKNIEFALKWIKEVYDKIDEDILLPLSIYKKLQPKDYEKRVFIGFNYDFLAQIGRPIETYIKKNNFLPIICFDFKEIPKSTICNCDISILRCCKLAIFDVTKGNGHMIELAECARLKEINVLIVYGTREPGGPPPPDLSSMITTGFKDPNKFTKKGYSNMDELEKIVADWLSKKAISNE